MRWVENGRRVNIERNEDVYAKGWRVEIGDFYNPKLHLGCNLGKDLRKNENDDQLVKYKDTELYLLLYIPINYEE